MVHPATGILRLRSYAELAYCTIVCIPNQLSPISPGTHLHSHHYSQCSNPTTYQLSQKLKIPNEETLHVLCFPQTNIISFPGVLCNKGSSSCKANSFPCSESNPFRHLTLIVTLSLACVLNLFCPQALPSSLENTSICHLEKTSSHPSISSQILPCLALPFEFKFFKKSSLYSTLHFFFFNKYF